MEITLSKNKPVVEDIAISKDKLDEFNWLLKKQSQNKNRTIREYYRGVCTVCATVPSKKVKYDLEGFGKRLEFYCDKCFERWVVNATRTFT